MMTDCTLIKNLILKNNEQLLFHLKKLDCELYLNNLIYKLLIGLFFDGISEIYQLIIWDLFLLEGNITFFKAAYGLIKIISKELLEANSIDKIQYIFEKKIMEYDNTAKLIYFLIFKRYDDFDNNVISLNRKIILPKIIIEINSSSYENNENKDEIECDLDWPLCSRDNNYRHEIREFVTYRQLLNPNIIEDYFYGNEIKEKNKNNNKEKDEYDIYGEICIERRKHICNSKIESFKEILKERYKDEKIDMLKYQYERKRTFTTFYNRASNIIIKHKDDNAINKIVSDIEKGNEILLSKLSMPKQTFEEFEFEIENLKDD